MNWSERETETSGDIQEVKAQCVSSVTWLRPPRKDPAAYMRLSEERALALGAMEGRGLI